MKRPALWIVLAAVSVIAAWVGSRYFPRAFSIVALNITMDRERALDEARDVMAREKFGPAGYKQAASFTGDDEAQTFVELEGGGKEAFTRMLRDQSVRGIHMARAALQGGRNQRDHDPVHAGWKAVRLRRAGQGGCARRRARRSGGTRDCRGRGDAVECRSSPVRRGGAGPGAPSIAAGSTTPSRTNADIRNLEGRSVPAPARRCRDRLTEVTHFIKIPESFTRRYASMRSANEAIGIGSVVAMALLYVFGGIGVGLFFMMRRRYVLWRQAAFWGVTVGLLQTLASSTSSRSLWMSYDTAIPRSTYIAQQLADDGGGLRRLLHVLCAVVHGGGDADPARVRTAPQLWRSWSRGGAGASTAILGRTVGGYLLVSVFFAYDVVLYLVMTKAFGWWSPADALVHPDVLATYAPWLSAIANSFQAGFWEEALFRAVPLAGAALIGDRIGTVAAVPGGRVRRPGHRLRLRACAVSRTSRRSPDRSS